MGYLIFDGTNTAEHNIVISGEASFNAPERDVETISVPGRNGDIVIDHGRYNNIPVEYPAGITKDFISSAKWARSFFLAHSSSYYRLTDSYDAEHFRLARYTGGMEFNPTALNFHGETTLTFDCKPQRFLLSGETEQSKTNGSAIENPTLFEARPLITISSASNGAVLTINGYTIRFTAAISNGATIDCELMECFNGATNLNNKISCVDFPVLSSGSNTISWTGTISGFKITPRWWEL